MSTGKLVAQAATAGPVRSKAVEDTRPSDFQSFKVTSGRPDLIRLIVARFMTSDGQDAQDDYTVSIERKQWRKSLDSIIRSSFGKDRGISGDDVQIYVKFLLPQAGAGLGWLDIKQSPLQLKLKDSDIMEVLFAKPLEVVEDSMGSRADAVKLVAGASVKDMAELWAAIARYEEDDLIVAPGLELLANWVEKQPALCKSALSIRGNKCDVVQLLGRLLSELHNNNARVQAAGWRLLTQAAKQEELKPSVRRLKAAAVRLERMQTDGVRPWALFLEMQGGYVPKAPEQGVLALVPQVRLVDPATAPERWRDEATKAAVKLETAVRLDDTMDIEKALHHLILKMQRRDVNWRSVEETGVGLIFRQLSGFHGDGDIRLLARKAVLEAAKLQQADAIR